MTIRLGDENSIIVNGAACVDHQDHVAQMQTSLARAARLMDAIADHRIEGLDVEAATYFAAIALERMSAVQADDATIFADDLAYQIRMTNANADAQLQAMQEEDQPCP